MKRAASIALIACAAGCRPGVGSRCEAGEERCLDGARALVCEAERFIETPCRGKEGCRTLEAGTACDISGNQEGDRCSSDQQGAAACSDARTMIVCRGGRYVKTRCLGPGGCAVAGGRAVCDTTLAAPADVCEVEGKRACSADGTSLLTCERGRFVVSYPCRGERGCVASSGKLDCDVTLAVEGEGCDPRADGHVVCAADRRATLVCKNGRFVRDAACKRGTHCEIDGTTTRCRPTAPAP